MTNDKYLNQIALVTGAGRGIGRAVAIALAATGRYVYINYKSNESSANQTLDIIEKLGQGRAGIDEQIKEEDLQYEKGEFQGGRGELIQFDVADQLQSEAAIKSIIQKHDKIDILVNNAGIKDDKLMVMMKKNSWDSVINTNLTGFYNVTKLAVKNMIKNQFGRVVNITSTSGQLGVAGQVNYSASKAGLIGATKALAREVASRNITVNAVAPGFIETDMVKTLPLDEIVKSIPAKKVGKPEDVAQAVIFLCSYEASYITGQVLGVNGGIY
ncbi:MAG: 3-oxoacyl-ACP reductase FabG [Desulfamplus sp.]|nr:3-oxoacyl-ACP reductase FabG [Desulfamplus sp.]MBF0411964.1 3-oxoacyl-ACP reductase FabG [Desulfamplus sp.]